MNPGNILDLARAQGPAFWLAAAAMAAAAGIAEAIDGEAGKVIVRAGHGAGW